MAWGRARGLMYIWEDGRRVAKDIYGEEASKKKFIRKDDGWWVERERD